MRIPAFLAHLVVGSIELILVLLIALAGAWSGLQLGFSYRGAEPFVAIPFAAAVIGAFWLHPRIIARIAR